MFKFEDLPGLPPDAIRQMLARVDNRDLAVAFTTASEEVKKAVHINLSARNWEMLLDDMEIMGPFRMRDVEDARQQIATTVLGLADNGDILLPTAPQQYAATHIVN